MADDRIQLNLVLNEATVSAVEGRVRNLVNRLNNTNISLNIDARNLNNIENQFNRIQQKMQTINATPVNINANLTSAQQQYRLKTERMRVSQQLELSRQRTLQTENQAISALAQQNRTLTVNNNITHQIEQGAQNIGNNMNVAGGHARDFVDYLADGVRYIIVYRSLYEIMNQVGEAFSEMKNVDKELISVRKTTGMAENEIKKIRKASYGVATEYGRTASEYLGSVSEFARGGYKELSTELAKVSLLTQNVGDVSADSANKMLLSVDAAYKLKGNVTELTNVVNGLNNIANLNPTSMQKMADGMQVSASMAKVAGLEISDLVALIGTGTAVTQREGGEIARAIRTILMNIRAQKGELEDGTVIDDESIAKAEAALKGVGIATKEVVNCVRELRDPMDILDELAGKWSTLNTEAKSVVLESLANKRQANVLAAILENYEMVGKMQSEYLNSANSAIKENELFLQGWEATQNKVSAKWTEFIANMADTAVITGSLNALYDALVVLDTPIGRIATSIILVNTALAVSNRLWQAIRARSIVADILSLGMAERNLGGAIQLVTGHLGRQALAWAASPMGMATIAVAGISLITSAIEKNSQKLEENAQKAGEAYDKVKSNMNELDGLIKQYNDLQISNEWNNTPVETKKQLHEDINRLLGEEANKVDILNGKYKETTEELFKQRMAKLSEAEKTAFDNEQAKSKTLWDEVRWNNGIRTSYTSILSDKEEEVLDKYSHIFMSDHTTARGEDVHNYQLKFDNLEDFLNKYDESKKLLQDMYNEGLGETETYKELNTYIAQFDTKVDEYKSAVEELEKTKAGQKLGNYITQNVGGYIDDLEEYNKVVDWIKNNFTGEDKNSALSFLNSYFSEYAEKVTETSDLLSGDYTSAIKSVSATLSTLQDKYDELKSAQEEYNSTGAISAETMQKLIDNDLLQYLDYSSGKLKINTDALLAEGEAAKVNAIQKLQDAMATDLMNLATGKTDQLSNTAKTAIANLGSAAESTGNKAQTAASKLAGFAIAAQAAKDGAEGNLTGMSVEDFNTQANAIISAYTSAANSIGGITIKSPKTSKGSSSSSKNNALEKHLKDAERRYKIHQDETKYIEELNYALNKLVKTDEERLEILDKIEDARKDYADNRIKDLEHEKEMLKNMYGDNYDTSYIDKSIQQIHHEEADRYREFARKELGYYDEGTTDAQKAEIDAMIEKTDEIQEHQSGWWDAENKIAEAPLSIVDSYDTALSQIERKANEIDLQLQKAEANGLMASTRYYETMAKYETETLAKLREEKMALTNALNDAVNTGDIEVGTDAWYKMRESIDEVTESILSSEIALSEFNKKMKQIVSDRFDYFIDNFSRLTNEADYLIELLGEDLHTDNGQLNDKGITSAGLHGLNYNVYMEKALSYANELKRIEDEIASNPNDISLLERREQLLELQRESVLAAQDKRQAIVDLVQQGIDAELNALQKLIDKYNESLDSAKDLYDYQKRIGEQTDNIASLEKQLSAYEGDTSEETRAKIQQLKVQLDSAKDNLKDTEYERYVGEQKKLLDDLYGDLEETLNEKIEDIDGIVENVIDKINSNSKTIANTLKSESAKYGSSISQEMKSVWTSEKQALNDYFGNGSSIGGFALGANGFFTGVGTNTVSGIVSVLTSISNDVNKILREASIVAQTGMDSETTKNQMIQNSKDWFIKDETGRKELESENQKYGSALGYTYKNGTWYDSNGNIAYGVSTNEKISTIVSKMRQNGADWHVSSDSGKKQLEDENNRLAQQIENLSGKSVTKDSNGIWWIGNQELFKTYKTGGLVDYTGLAKLDGTPSKPELVLNAQDTQNFIALNDTLRNIQSQGLNLAALNHYSLADMVELPSIPDFSHLVQNKASSIGDVHMQVNIEIDHVDDYNDLVNKMRNDKQFEKMIQSVSVDLLSGKSSLAKNKYKW